MRKLLTMVLLLVSPYVFAADEIYTGFFSSKALDGYDTVAYFTSGKPVEGSKKFNTEYKGADWYFSSEKNLTLFVNNPEKYAPQYGGYCAWAVSAKSDFAPGDPHQWSIVDNKLYLNYDQEIKQRWEQDQAQHIQQADKVWPKLIK
ncbi:MULTISPECIES: YHS domain-containing (seleno)protein [Vibrio]|uniref:YHS domain-containing (Seleno)protein n=1 Tax=Vibrio kanaloae TaxID=170673 RepID=A0ABV4LGF4_9VIBR|nr:YHS domain-containing (seleno)protein [Vibrio kanaloae]MCG9558252.1 YHS domain-containing protein [Vibrio kanaloae]NOI03152.1 YHS domain-containing protein [Vibrio kanaloae]OEF11519.1 YHS domain protein [Vibrio kanaloae 5S-149]QPK03256.1 YHS domain-containing protein [Vibrio kanaloae]TKF05307.1 YHS domain-containing protein [Vibrio kanaloae]